MLASQSGKVTSECGRIVRICSMNRLLLLLACWMEASTITSTTKSPCFFATAFEFPDTTGPFATGVRDLEFVDSKYPSPFAHDDPVDGTAGGRRIMLRAFYPICRKDVEGCGTPYRQRLYYEEGEFATFHGVDDDFVNFLVSTFDSTNSFVDAPPLVGSESFPLVLYSHGYESWVWDNTALLEEVASNGYVVFAVGSPGLARGLVYPTDGQYVDPEGFYPEVELLFRNDPVHHPLPEGVDLPLEDRFQATADFLENGAFPVLQMRMRDDLLATADYLTSVNTTDPFVRQLVLDGSTTSIVYMGFSLGGTASASAAQIDPRAVGSVNLDGYHMSNDLLNTWVRVPHLTFAQNSDQHLTASPNNSSSSAPEDSVSSNLSRSIYYNDFFFEPLELMGKNFSASVSTTVDTTTSLLQDSSTSQESASSSLVQRVWMPEGTNHLDFTDVKHLAQAWRELLLQTAFHDAEIEQELEPVDGPYLHNVTSTFIVDFLDTQMLSRGEVEEDAIPVHPHPEDFPGFATIDVGYVAEWASSRDTGV